MHILNSAVYAVKLFKLKLLKIVLVNWIKAGIKYVRGKTWALNNMNGSLATNLNVIRLR